MNILITGSDGFVGKNLKEALFNIRDGKNRTRPELDIGEVYLFDVRSDSDDLERYCSACDFVFHLAGVNRPKTESEFTQGNAGLTEKLVRLLEDCGNNCPVMLSSSVQATLQGRYAGSPYGKSKAEAEEALFEHARRTGAPAYVFRLPNLFGKWSRPDYNTVVATFCHHIARGMPINVSDPSVRLELLYIDDLVSVLLDALRGDVVRCTPYGEPDEGGAYCLAPGAHSVTLGRIAELIYAFNDLPRTLTVPDIPDGSFEKKLYSTFLSFIPPEQAAYPLARNCDARGSFTELVKTVSGGQFSVNISEPGITKGQHWHDSKWELFIVVSGEALIQERAIGTEEVFEFRVSGDEPYAVRMLPGYTHNIINLSKTEKLITLMWANERFDPGHPDTFFEPVQEK